MAVLLGRTVTIKKNDVTIAKVTSGSFSGSAGTIDLTSLGDQWNKFGVGMNEYSIDMTILTVSDNTEQNAIRDAWIAKTELTDITINLDSTTIIECDIDTDSEASMIVSSWALTIDNGSAVEQAVTLTGNGPIKISTE